MQFCLDLIKVGTASDPLGTSGPCLECFFKSWDLKAPDILQKESMQSGNTTVQMLQPVLPCYSLCYPVTACVTLLQRLQQVARSCLEDA